MNLRFFLFLLILFAIIGCGDKAEKQGVDTTSAGDVCFENDLQQLGKDRCAECHSYYNSYEKAKSCGESCNNKIQNGEMPPDNELPDDEKAVFQAWIEQDMPACEASAGDDDDTAADDDTVDDDDNDTTDNTVTFTEDIQPVFKNLCGECHSYFNSYQSAKSRAESCNKAIQNGSMPPSGELSQEQKDLFQAWIDQGLLE
ncbi:MAG: hypothetical protein PHQ00_05940 [Phycisphaerae bacterium]|nr:hypothetical protein [Phycisphaerae bacterium]